MVPSLSVNADPHPKLPRATAVTTLQNALPHRCFANKRLPIHTHSCIQKGGRSSSRPCDRPLASLLYVKAARRRGDAAAKREREREKKGVSVSSRHGGAGAGRASSGPAASRPNRPPHDVDESTGRPRRESEGRRGRDNLATGLKLPPMSAASEGL